MRIPVSIINRYMEKKGMPYGKCRKNTENHHFGTIRIKVDSGQNHQWMHKLLEESLRGTGYLHFLKVFPTEDLLVTKVKIVTYSEEPWATPH